MKSKLFLISVLLFLSCSGNNPITPDPNNITLISMSGHGRNTYGQLSEIAFSLVVDYSGTDKLKYNWSVSNGKIKILNPENLIEFTFTRTGQYLFSCAVSNPYFTKNLSVTVFIYMDYNNVLKWKFTQPKEVENTITF